MRVVAVTANIADNALLRVLFLWRAARTLDFGFHVISTRKDSPWAPLTGSTFLEGCPFVDLADRQSVRGVMGSADVVIAHKPMPASLLPAIELSEQFGIPLLVDIDDPDLELRLGTARGLVRTLVRPGTEYGGNLMQLAACRRLARQLPVMVPNPSMQRIWGGVVVPHLGRAEPGNPHVSDNPVVCFVGTVQPHKGVDVLREAVSRVASEGFHLVVTDDAPADARPWERWIPSNNVALSQSLLQQADIAVVPSRPHKVSHYQLPAKLCDAMVAERAVVASDFGPISWGLGDTGLLVPPGDPRALAEALRRLRSPPFRQEMAGRARQRGMRMFGTHAVARQLSRAVHHALEWKHTRMADGRLHPRQLRS